MLRYSKIASIIIIMFTIFLASNECTAGIYVQLEDAVNKTHDKIQISGKLLRIESKKETIIANLETGQVLNLNPENNTYRIQSSDKIEKAEKLLEKHNKDSIMDLRAKTSKITIKKIKQLKLQNRPYKAALISYKRGSGGIVRRTGAYNRVLGIFSKEVTANKTARRLLKRYLSSEELETLKAGFIPFRTSKAYTLIDICEKNIAKGLFKVPKGYIKRSDGDYFKDMALALIGGKKGSN